MSTEQMVGGAGREPSAAVRPGGDGDVWWRWTPDQMAEDRDGAHRGGALDDLSILSRPLKKRSVYVVASSADSMSGRIVNCLVTFRLLQPIPCSPVAPDEYLARICQVTPKKIGTDVQESVPISVPPVPGLSKECPGFSLWVVEIDLALPAC